MTPRSAPALTGGGISILVGDGAISALKIVKKAAWQGQGG